MSRLTKEQLASMSKEEKILYLEAVKEKARRKKANKLAYSPNKGQLQIHKSEASEVFVFSGNGFGKTTLLVNEVLWAAQGYNPIKEIHTKAPANIIMVLDSPEKIESKILPEIKKWYNLKDDQLHKKGKPYYSEIHFPNGSKITFMFFDQDDLKYEGIDDIDFVASDEPMPRSRYVALYRGLRGKGTNPKVLIVGTPISQQWLRTEVYEPWLNGDRPGTECFRGDTEDNRENLREGYIEEFASKLSEEEKEVRLRGGFFDAGRLALAHLFDRKTHVVPALDIPSNWPAVVACDPHPSKNHIAILLVANPHGELLYVKELSSKLPPREFAAQLKEWYRGYRVVDIICDSLGATPMSGGDGNKTFIQVLNEGGVRARATTFKEKSDEDFIQKLQEVLVLPLNADNFGRKIPKLRIFEGNYGIIRDVENATWQRIKGTEENKPKLEIGNRDYLACLKYALSTNLRFDSSRGRIIGPKSPVGWGQR